MNKSMNATGGHPVRRGVRGIAVPVALSAVVAALVTAGVIVGADSARAQTPYPGPAACAQLWEHPHSADAQACRDKGWVIERHLIVNRNGNAWTDVHPLREEDGHWGYWDAEHMGNHHGDSFVALGGLGRFYVRSIKATRGPAAS